MADRLTQALVRGQGRPGFLEIVHDARNANGAISCIQQRQGALDGGEEPVLLLAELDERWQACTFYTKTRPNYTLTITVFCSDSWDSWFGLGRVYVI